MVVSACALAIREASVMRKPHSPAPFPDDGGELPEWRAIPSLRHSRSNRFDRGLFMALIAIVALAPLPLASNRPLPSAILCAAVSLLLIVWGTGIAFGWTRQTVSAAKLKWVILLYGTTCLWIFVQTLTIVPAGWQHPIWSDSAGVLGVSMRGAISVAPSETMIGLLRLLAYAGIFWLSVQLCRQERRANRAVCLVTMIGATYCAYGLVIYALGNDWILIYRKWAYPESLTGTFVNRNSFATFVGLCLVVAVAYLIDISRNILSRKIPVRQKIVELGEKLIGNAWLSTFPVLLMAVVLLLTQSRGGILSSAIAVLLLLVIVFFRLRLTFRQMALVAVGVSLLATLVFLTSGKMVVDRLGAGEVGSANSRTALYEIVIGAIEDSPWIGTGFSTFADIFPWFRDLSFGNASNWKQAHNTYLENAFEIGIPATVALNLAILLLAWQCLLGMRKRRQSHIIPAIGVAATILVGLHSLVDFSLQMPAVSALYAFILGLGVSQSWSSQESGST